MKAAKRPKRTKAPAVQTLMLFQGVWATFFLLDILADFLEEPASMLVRPHFVLEALATFGLIGGIIFEGAFLARLLRRQAQADRALSVASGALQEVVEGYFEDWRLTPAEAEVAALTIKGFSIAEIATLRGSAEGTVKTHLNAIYRKADVPGRAQLVNLLIEELLHSPLVRPEGAALPG